MNRLSDVKAPVSGVVLSQVDGSKSAAYGHYGEYSYYGGYGKL